jgi:hypothetical protein
MRITLELEAELVQKAQDVSRQKGITLDSYVEQALQDEIEAESEVPTKSANIRSLAQMVRANINMPMPVPEDFDYKEYIAEERHQDYIRKQKPD